MNTTNIKTKNNVPGHSNFAQKKNVNINTNKITITTNNISNKNNDKSLSITFN